MRRAYFLLPSSLLPSSLILVLSALLLAGCHDKAEKTAAAVARPVQVVTAAAFAWPKVVTVPATVSAVDTATLASRAGGWVTRVAVDAGAQVAPGTLLAEVGATDARSQLADAKARAATAAATLKEAAADERRYSALYRAHAASAQQYEAAERRFVAARSEVAMAAAAIATAKSNLEYAEIRAPFAGIVAEKNVWVGDFAAPGQSLFVIASGTPEIRAHVGPATYGALKVGEKAEVTIDGATRSAVVASVVAAADPKTRTHLVKLRLQGAAAAPFGAYAELHLTLGTFSALAVPATAVTRRAGLVGVFVVDKDHHTHFRLVRTGQDRDGRVEIVAGLTAGETVVAAPSADLANDSPVAPQALAPASGGAGPRRG